MWQVNATSGAVKAYYSWKVQNPNEALHDVMVSVDALKGSKEVHIPWNKEAEKNAEEVSVSGNSNNDTIMESPLYGAMVGVDNEQNTFTLSYNEDYNNNSFTTSYDNVYNNDSNWAVLHTGDLLPLLAAFVLTRIYLFPSL